MSEKAVIVVDRDLPLGLLANAIAAASFSLGQTTSGLCGPDVHDAGGNLYRGITRIPLPILTAPSDRMREIRLRAREPEFEGIVAIDFTEQAQRPQTYEDYVKVMAKTAADAVVHRALLLYGVRKKIERLTGNLPLLR